ncbi:ImmA/IrrE family metallo-endopeptidase [Rothia sp. SD9660Na]|uniref:ImmA/IrrE family metallo-endopeptidase n=1 Tax=Rothia sp. SD9660Na TaxID=3047030 RepID=UPI0024BA6BC3|nr:ImmA/IrrE family metallo-endopeptidase [Rothia sp. SD9660Na]WHS50331.1 ImmA/IrrE family metallo-endopeptidase [Rothia sp. SD9660Na]
MSVRVPVKPALISWALEQASVEPGDLRLGDKVVGWLEGSLQPTLKQLQDFAKSTHVPFGYLMMSEPPVLEKPLPDFRRRDGRSSRYSQELTDEIYAQQRKQVWFRDYALDQGLDVVDWVGSASLSDAPETVAMRLREQWNFYTASKAQSYVESRKEVFTFLENQGVLVSVAGYFGSTRRPFDTQEFSGFSLSDEYAPLIFVNGKESHAAQVFTMFHEVGHLVLGESGVSDDAEESGSLSRSERWCDEFAAAFLMPASEVSRLALRSLGEDAVLPVAKRFRVSALALLNRLRDLKLISCEQWSVAYPEFEARALEVLRQKTEKGSSGGEFYKSHPFVVGPRFARAVYREARSGRMSYPDAQHLLGVRQTKTFERFAREVGAW